MASSIGRSTGIARRAILRFNRSFSSSTSRLASSSSSPLEDPGKLVDGLSSEALEANPEIAEFLKVNFEDDDDEITDGFVIPPEILKDYGISPPTTSDDAAASPKSSYGTPKVDLGLGNEAQQALNIRVLSTYLRSAEVGTNACYRLRDEKMIPGMLYGGNPDLGIASISKDSKQMLKTPWPELQRELDRFHRKFESRVYDLTVYEDESDTEGTVHRVVPCNVQRHPVQGSIFCANFLRYHPKRPLKIPIVYINQEESPALKRDGFIIPVNKYVECFVEEGVPIPEKLELECTGVELKDILRLDRIIFPDGVRHTDRIDPEKFVIGPVKGGRGGAGDDDEDGEGEAAGDSEE